MKTVDDSFNLAKEMVGIGTHVGKNTIAIVSDMDEPLGFAVGNALEVIEAIETLKGNGPKDLYDLCIELGSNMLLLSEVAKDKNIAKKMLENSVRSGKAFEKFKEFVKAQGGDISVIENTNLLPASKYNFEVKADRDGYVSKIIADEIGLAALSVGAGRETKESVVDPAVGVVIKKKVGDKVNKGENIAIIYANNIEKAKEAEFRIKNAYHYSEIKPEKRPLIFGVVTKDGIERY